MSNKFLYLDNAATTRVDSKVAEEMNRVHLEEYGNPSSLHEMGRRAKEKLEQARKRLAEFIGASENEIIFTSGGTEANNLAIRGVAKANPEKKHIITTEIEHPCILETCEDLKKQGYEVDLLKVDSEGLIDLEELKSRIREDTLLVSVMHVNNEIGVIQPVEEVGAICSEKGVYFHTDAVQSFVKLDLDVEALKVDLLSVSAHKVHGPKGVGFLYVRKSVNISAIITGGGQEKRIRSGTENLPGIVGLAQAIEIKPDVETIRESRDKLLEKIMEIPGVKLNGSREKRIYNNIHVSFYGIEGEGLMLMLDNEGIGVSTGSACASTKLSESHVLKAIGVDELYVHGSVRLSVEELNEEEIERISESIKKNVKKLEEMSPFKLNQDNN